MSVLLDEDSLLFLFWSGHITRHLELKYDLYKLNHAKPCMTFIVNPVKPEPTNVNLLQLSLNTSTAINRCLYVLNASDY